MRDPSIDILLEPEYGGVKLDMSLSQREHIRRAALTLRDRLSELKFDDDGELITPAGRPPMHSNFNNFKRFLSDVGIHDIHVRLKPGAARYIREHELVLARSLVAVVLAQVDAYDAACMWGFEEDLGTDWIEKHDLFVQIRMLQRAVGPLLRIEAVADYLRGEDTSSGGGEYHAKKLDYLRYAVFVRKTAAIAPNDYYSKWRAANRAWNAMRPDQKDAWCVVERAITSD